MRPGAKIVHMTKLFLATSVSIPGGSARVLVRVDLVVDDGAVAAVALELEGVSRCEHYKGERRIPKLNYKYMAPFAHKKKEKKGGKRKERLLYTIHCFKGTFF